LREIALHATLRIAGEHDPARLNSTRNDVRTPAAGRTFRIGFDIGGTFTDFVLLDQANDRIRLHKYLTTPEDPSIGALAGLGELLAAEGIGLGQVDEILHGTTLVTNAVIERRGARLGLITCPFCLKPIEVLEKASAVRQAPGPWFRTTSRVDQRVLCGVSDARRGKTEVNRPDRPTGNFRLAAPPRRPEGSYAAWRVYR
jgi:hypothetical protein